MAVALTTRAVRRTVFIAAALSFGGIGGALAAGAAGATPANPPTPAVAPWLQPVKPQVAAAKKVIKPATVRHIAHW